MADIFRSAFGIFGGTKSDNDFVGQRVDLGSVQLRVKKLIAEGAYGFVFIAQDVSSGKDYALKRLMAGDEAANKAIIQEISFMKRLRGHPNIVQFLNAASIGANESDHGMAEFLILTELCTGGQLIKWFNDRQGKPIPSNQVLRIFHQICRAVSHMHKQNPPIIHRDLKIENLLVSSRGQIKLCDFGSATTKSLYPTDSWTSVERSLVEDEIQRNTTPMYRAPEMVDLYSNYPITSKSDIWALGCLLYMLCYMDHPFEDGAKLRILNAKFTLPESDKEYGVFHDLIDKMLQVDPVKRPDISEIVTDLEGIALSRYVELKGSIFQGEESLVSAGQGEQDQPAIGNAMLGVVKGAGSFFSNIKDMSSKMVQSVAGYVKSDLDISYITSRVIVMPIPGEGIESTYKNSVDDVQIFLDTKHPSRFAIVNLSQRPAKLKGKVFDCDWSSKRAPPLEKIFLICKKIVAWLKTDKKNVVVIQCQDGKLTSGLLVTSLFLYCHLFMSPECAFEMFNIRRQNMSTKIVPNPSQKHYFNYITQLINDPDVKPHKCYLTLNALTMEPVPLFNKAKKGCRPFIEVYNGDKRVLTTAREIEKMREFTVSDEEIEFKLRIEIQGDVTLCVYHGRSTLGGKVQGKLTSIPMFQLQFHTGFIGKTAKKMVFIKEDIDILEGNFNKFAENFNITLSIDVDESQCSDVTYVWDSNQNEKATRQLLFTTSEEYLQCQEDLVLGDDREMSYREQFELDRKSRKQNSSHRNGEVITGRKPDVNKKTNEEKMTGSFLNNLDWQAEEPRKENSTGELDSDDDWETLREPGGLDDDVTMTKGKPSFDFFSESVGGGGGKDEGIDLFNLRDQEQPKDDKDVTQGHTQEDLLGFNLDNGEEPVAYHDTNANLPSPKSSKDTRHSSFGEQQLRADFDLLNFSREHSKEDSDVSLLGEAHNVTSMRRNKSADDILIHSPTNHSVTDNDFFSGLDKPSENVSVSNSFDPLGNRMTKGIDLLGDLGTPASNSGTTSSVLKPEVNVSGNQNNLENPQKPNIANDPFADLGSLRSKNGYEKVGNNVPTKTSGDPFSSFGKTGNSSTRQSSTKGFQNSPPSWGKTSQTKPAQKPNYAPSYSSGGSSVFGPHGLKDSYVNKQVGKDEFSDILNSHGFKPSSVRGPNTINSLRKQAEVEDDPVKAKVRSWSEGKRKNIRALLCSLDTVLWEGEKRWKKVGMHELVHADQVKKCYKRAVLSVHPDKLIGTPEEHLARAIFIELNESWAAFEESGSKSLY